MGGRLYDSARRALKTAPSVGATSAFSKVRLENDVSARTQHKALLTGALGLLVALSGCAADSRHEVDGDADDTKHTMLDLMMCDPCCGALLRLFKTAAPASENSAGAHPARNEVGAAPMPHTSDHRLDEPPD